MCSKYCYAISTLSIFGYMFIHFLAMVLFKGKVLTFLKVNTTARFLFSILLTVLNKIVCNIFYLHLPQIFIIHDKLITLVFFSNWEKNCWVLCQFLMFIIQLKDCITSHYALLKNVNIVWHVLHVQYYLSKQ